MNIKISFCGLLRIAINSKLAYETKRKPFSPNIDVVV